MQIIVDDREYKSQVVDWLLEEENVEIIRQRLPFGDYLVNNELIFERKTLIDFASSIKDGRLFRQMHSLLGSGKKCALLLEGTSKDLVNSQMRREALQGALIQITLFMGIPVLRAMDGQESARLMLYAAQQAISHDHKKFVSKRNQPHKIKSKLKRQLYLLQGVPGLGPQRAKSLLEKFGSIEKILLADEQALCDVPGIGHYTAHSIQWVLKENEATYNLWFPEL